MFLKKILKFAAAAALGMPGGALWGETSPGLPDQLTPDGLAELVQRANPGLMAIEAAAEAAAQRIALAGALDDPMMRYGIAPLTFGGHVGQRFEFSQKLPWPGTLDARESAARHEAEAAFSDARTVRLRVVAQAKSALAEWWLIDRALEVHQDNLDLLDELVATARSHYAAGRVPKQDVLQAEVERTRLDRHLFELLRRKATAQARINGLLNRQPDAALPPADLSGLPTEPGTLATLEALALNRHPELARLDARHAASLERVTLAEKAFYPDFQLGVGYNGLWNDPDDRPMVGVSINVPLDRGKRHAELSRRQAESNQAEWALIERKAGLLANLAQTRAAVIESRDATILYEAQLLPLAADFLDATLADYQSGRGAFLNVITAEQRKLETELALIRAQADLARRLAELEFLAGGSIDPVPLISQGAQP